MQPKKRPSALRFSVLVIGVVLLSWAAILWFQNHSNQAVWPCVIYGVILVAAIAFERRGYHPGVDRSARGWQPTDEKFIDPVTGEPVQVWFNPKTGERDYRPTDPDVKTSE